MAIHEWAALTFEDVRSLDRGRAVAVLPVGAIEAHGPHLPLATDGLIAEAMARAGALRLTSHGLEVVLLPVLPFATAPFAAAFPGTLSIRAQTVTALVLDLARELTRQGFAALAVASAHLDPAHRESLGAASKAAEEEGLLPVVWPDLARKPWALMLTPEFQSGACHAGRFEGSVVLAVRPEWVREEVRVVLPPNERSLSKAIRDGARTFEEAGGPRAYFGTPGDATAEEGRATIETLGAILADAVRAALPAARES
ncbi:MAG: creatininase family protein [Candidatus Eiseniibacteriota bacterium]